MLRKLSFFSPALFLPLVAVAEAIPVTPNSMGAVVATGAPLTNVPCGGEGVDAISSANAATVAVSFVSNLCQLVTQQFWYSSLLITFEMAFSYGLLITVFRLLGRIQGRSARRNNNL
jgi:hypothetical protein